MEVLPEQLFKDRVKILVDKVGSAEKLAQLSGMSSRAIGKYLAGESDPSRERLVALAKAGGVDIAWLAAGGDFVVQCKAYPAAEALKTAGYVSVPRYEVSASAGGGAVVHSEQIVDHLSFKAEWIHNALGVPVSSLALINVKGDSMEPTLSNGDVILIDMSTHIVEDNSIYVLRFDGNLVVKRIQRKFDGSVVIKSDNALYEPEVVRGDLVNHLNVIGRVVWCGRRM